MMKPGGFHIESKKKKQPKTKFKFVVTHMDEFVMKFSVWEYTDEPLGWTKNGSLWMHRPGYELVYKILHNAGVMCPSEFKLAPTDNDTPAEACIDPE